MMSRAARSLPYALLCLCSFPITSWAEIGGLDDVPAASLLLPYFEVELDDPFGLTTLFSVTNAGAEATIANVTLWSDLGIPTLSFNIYLTGYDIHTVNLRDLFNNGALPGTASSGQDSSDTISPGGPFSFDSDFDGCDGILPYAPTLPASFVAHVRAAHTGKASSVFLGQCAGFDFEDNTARGYLTIDQVETCTFDFPGQPGYFDPNVIGFANVLVGDYFYVDPAENFAQGETMVHLEADPSLDADNYTFYRALSGGIDRREGLGNAVLARYVSGGAFDGGTDFVVWRDTRKAVEPFACGGALPQPFPLQTDQLAAFDEQENVEIPGNVIADPPPPFPPAFPLAANRVSPNSPGLELSAEFGWLYVNLNSLVSGSTVPFDRVSQGFVNVLMKANGRFSVGFDAYQLSNVTDPANAVVEPIGVPP